MTNDQLVEKAKQVWAAAGTPILRVVNREDDPQAVSCEFVADTGLKRNGEIVHDYLNMTLYKTGQMVWADFSHSTPIGKPDDTVKTLGACLKRILDLYQPKLVPAHVKVSDLNNLVRVLTKVTPAMRDRARKVIS